MPVASVSSNWVNGHLVFYDLAGRVMLHLGNGGAQALLTKRARIATAAINTGAELLPAIPGFRYRLVEATMIAIGGAAATCTTVDILGTQSAGSVKLVAGAQASLTENTQVEAGSAGAAILADGASYVACDVNTAITVGSTTNNLGTATAVDFSISYVIEPA